MNMLLTVILLLLVLSMLIWGIISKSRIYQFPFLVGAITFSFILPQLPALVNDRFLPEDAYAKTIFFTILCVAMCWLGWSPKAKPLSFFKHDFDEKRLLIVALLFSLCGAFFYYKLSRLPGEMIVGVQMSGASVMYLFFGRFLTYGLAIAVICLANRLSWMALVVICFDLVFYMDRLVVTGKRGEALELLIIFALAFYFYRGWVIPRFLILAGIVLGTLLMTSMSDYRQITRANSGPVWQDIMQIDVSANFANAMRDGGGHEMQNAIYRIYNTEHMMEFDYGKFHWNRLVFNYVPAQLLGDRLKSSLMFSMPALARDYQPFTGTTETGMADAFQSFWYFGALKFLLLSYLMCRLWKSANSGAMAARFVYILSIIPAMHAISHQTDWVVMIWPHMLIFVVPAFIYARIPAARIGLVFDRTNSDTQYMASASN